MRQSRSPLLPFGCAAALLATSPAHAVLPSFEPASPWTQDVSAAPTAKRSANTIAWLDQAGGFGLGRMQIDFSIEVLDADAQAPFLSFQPTADFYDPDCDLVPVPLPAGGALEGESGYACLSDGDCHLLVWHHPTQKLYEMWRADVRGSTFLGGCLAVWDLARPYGPTGRGAQCTSADAAGFPMAPLLFDADEVASGEIRHAIRFILPNPRIRSRSYVAPATHATGVASGGADAPPYGARLRLRADYPVQSLPTAGARVVARALQRYGMMLADGGNVALTARSDRFTQSKWNGLLGSRDLQALRITDFQVVDSGAVQTWNGDCVRTGPVPAAPGLAGAAPTP